MDYKEFSRCIECKGMFQNKYIRHISGLGFFCPMCYEKNKDVIKIINNFEKYKK